MDVLLQLYHNIVQLFLMYHNHFLLLNTYDDLLNVITSPPILNIAE